MSAPARAADGEGPGPQRVGRWTRRRWLSLIGALVALAVGAWYIARHRDVLAAEVTVRPVMLAPLIAVELSLLVLRGALLRALCRAFGTRLAVSEAAGLAAGSSLANYVVPGVGGGALRAGYLQRRHGLPYADFLSVLTATYLLQYLVVACSGLALLPALDELPAAGVVPIGAVLLVTAALCALLLYRAPSLPSSGAPSLLRVVRRATEGWCRIRERGTPALVGIALGHLVVTGLSIGLAFAALGQAPGPLQALFLAVCSELSIALNLTPAGLGVVEGAVGLGAGLLGLSPPVAVAAAALRRLCNVTASAALGIAIISGGAPRPR